MCWSVYARGLRGPTLQGKEEAYRRVVLEFRYPLQLDVMEARGVYDAEADEKNVLGGHWDTARRRQQEGIV